VAPQLGQQIRDLGGLLLLGECLAERRPKQGLDVGAVCVSLRTEEVGQPDCVMSVDLGPRWYPPNITRSYAIEIGVLEGIKPL